MKQKVKYFASFVGAELEERINKYLEEERLEILDMQFSTCLDKNGQLLKAVPLNTVPRKGS